MSASTPPPATSRGATWWSRNSSPRSRLSKGELADRDRLSRRAVAQQRAEQRGQRERLEALRRSGDLLEAPPAVIERPALLALVEAGGVDRTGCGAGEEEALAMQHLALAPLHDALALPHPADLAVDRKRGLLAGLADGGVGIVFAGIDQAADHHPERVAERIGRVVDRGIVHPEQEEPILPVEQDQPRRRPFDHFLESSFAASTAP